MRDDRRLYVVCYDIRDSKRLRRVYKTMRGFGDHLQYSVFRCVMDRRRFTELRGALEEIIHHSEDSILMVPIGNADNDGAWRVFTMGVPPRTPVTGAKIVG